MPHKRNPVLTENITGLAGMVRAYVTPALENVVPSCVSAPPGRASPCGQLPGTEWLIRAEAGEQVELLPADRDACVGAVAVLCLPG